MANLAFKAEDMVRDVVVRFPKSSDYFRSHRIDFCCGGNRPLSEALEERGLSTEDVLKDLHRLLSEHPVTEENDNYAAWSSNDLIAYIVNKHHAYLREELPLIEQNVKKVFRVHGQEGEHLAEINLLFGVLKKELLEHTDKEEASVFPKMINWESSQEPDTLNKLRSSITELEAEHDAAGDILKRLRELTQDFTPPAHACTTYRMTYSRLEELEAMTFQHVHVENNILFPRY
ncbi:iron-sulfur cluster repair di-iron protein [Paenibacillus sp. YPG26]|uniref:iron-sulfur cluster repair di-iron protein n=1 Tax=Paenibacillus sp. YPG26 TaxID=2878915 RepID=UPI002041F300|nr:iron-sulfur cluster repair di-iron protein [Paenibacillus sp. YPG26]USB35037.1 iron-sulfur cluster repair di-iron protein [Paenibacillus sp. YPG26]